MSVAGGELLVLISKRRKLTLAVMLAVALVLIALGAASLYVPGLNYLRESITTFMALYAVVLGLNIILGYAGYVSFGHAVFYGVGAYVAMILMYYHGVSIYAAMIAAAAAAAALAYVLGLIVLRLRGAYFAIATIAVLEAFRELFSNIEYVGASEGLQLPVEAYDGYSIAGYEGLLAVHYISYLLLTAIVALGIVMNIYVSRSRLGAELRAVREDEDAAKALGVDTWKSKTLAFMLSSITPALAGAVIAWKRTIVLPGEFYSIRLSIEAIMSVMLGGAGTVLGPLVGTAILHVVKTLFLTSLPTLHLIVFGAAIAFIAQFAPHGIIGWLRLKSSKLRMLLE